MASEDGSEESDTGVTYDRELLLAELQRKEVEIKSFLRQIEAAKDERLAKQMYSRLSTLTGVAKRTWIKCK